MKIGAGKNIVVENCDIRSNSDRGLVIQGSSPEVVIRRCRIHHCKDTGAHVLEGKTTFEDSKFFKNGRDGAAVSGSGAAVFRVCEMRDNRATGFSVQGYAQASLENCRLYENSGAGVVVCHKARAEFKKCRMYTNEASGLHAWTKAKVELNDCDIYENLHSGLGLFEVEARVSSCRINRNKGFAIVAEVGTTGQAVDSDLTGNDRGPTDIDGKSPFQVINSKK